MKHQVFKHHWARWLLVLPTNTVYRFFHHAAGWYPHVIIRKMEEKKLKVTSPGLAGKPDVGNLVVLICLLIHVVLLFPPTASKHL